MFKTVAILLTIAAAIPPLDSSQLARVEVADQRSQTVDEAAFYALIENARDWPEDAGTLAAGDEEIVLPNFERIMAAPEAWQGRLVMIEGTLEALMPEQKWSRSGFGDVKGLNLRVGGQPVIVYLSDPPPLRIARGERTLAEQGARVKLVARFFKLVEQPSVGGGSKLYPVFVGRGVMALESADGGSGLPLAGAVPLLALLVAGCVFLLYYRVRGAGRRSVGGMSLAEYHQRKQRERRARPHIDEVAVDDAPRDLPDDPAAALDALAHDEPDVDADAAPRPHDR